MRFRKKFKRYFIAFIMLILSAYMATVIKNEVDAANPEYSLPIIHVEADGREPYVVRAGYTWNFGSKRVMSPYVSAADVPLVGLECAPEAEIHITFSAPVKDIVLYRGNGWEDDDFVPISDWRAPRQEGLTIYRLSADFDRGDITYFFALQVKKPL